MQINILQVYFKLILFLVSVARHTQSTHNKFVIPLQYLKKELKDEVEVNTINFDYRGQACTKYPK